MRTITTSSITPHNVGSSMSVNTSSRVSLPSTYYSHPYESELRSLVYTPAQLNTNTTTSSNNNINSGNSHNSIDISIINKTPAALLSIDEFCDLRSFEYIDTVEGLDQVVEEASIVLEIALSMCYHSYRSFQGVTCLLSLSTRDKDFVIDTLVLHKEMQSLLGVFTNPLVVKVLHCCDDDVVALQRDFGLYIVNCFDIYQACRILNYSMSSVSHLLEYYNGVELDKQHALFDWTCRPLPAGSIQIARQNCMYLLFLYDNGRYSLSVKVGREGIIASLDASRRKCLRRYEKKPYWERGYR